MWSMQKEGPSKLKLVHGVGAGSERLTPAQATEEPEGAVRSKLRVWLELGVKRASEGA